jgi:hypothetical protein
MFEIKLTKFFLFIFLRLASKGLSKGVRLKYANEVCDVRRMLGSETVDFDDC